MRPRLLTLCLLATLALLSGRPTLAAPPAGTRDQLGQDLFRAVTSRDRTALRALLAGGADPN